jgi:hypothetical protein
MTITATLVNPLNGQRQVDPSSSITISFSSTDPLVIGTLVTSINGQRAISEGNARVIDGYLTSDAYATRFINIASTEGFEYGDRVQLYDIDTSFVSTIVDIRTPNN